jgi:hypothetical protein
MGPSRFLYRIIRVNKKTITVEPCNMNGVCGMTPEPKKIALDWIDFSGTYGDRFYMDRVVPEVKMAATYL